MPPPPNIEMIERVKAHLNVLTIVKVITEQQEEAILKVCHACFTKDNRSGTATPNRRG
jgi:hypothetical protein